MTRLVMERKVLVKSVDDVTNFLKEINGVFLEDRLEKHTELRAAVTARILGQIATGSHSLHGRAPRFGCEDGCQGHAKG